jgi:hypothetical protein
MLSILLLSLGLFGSPFLHRTVLYLLIHRVLKLLVVKVLYVSVLSSIIIFYSGRVAAFDPKLAIVPIWKTGHIRTFFMSFATADTLHLAL